ncbi:hypothetical protein [Lysobacter sp. HA18]
MTREAARGPAVRERGKELSSFGAGRLALQVVMAGILGVASYRLLVDQSIASYWAATFARRGAWEALTLATLLGGLTLAAAAATFAFVAHPIGRSLSRADIAAAYLVAQGLKYVPGRIWGTAFQIRRTATTVGLHAALQATALHAAISGVGSVLVFALISPQAPLACVGMLLLTSWITCRLRVVCGTRRRAWRAAALVVTAMAVEWLFFWGLCALLFPAASPALSLKIGAIYSIAWLFAGLVSITPGGIVVREGAFVALVAVALPHTSDAVGFSVAARVVLTGGEILAAVGGWIWCCKRAGA